MREPTKYDPRGETLDAFLTDLGIRDEVYEAAAKAVLVHQLEAARKAQKLTKRDMAAAMGMSRTTLDRVLDPQNVEVSFSSLERAARAVGKVLRIGLADAS